jgi:hypothetical protein
MLNKLRKTTTSGFQKTVNKKNRHHPLQVSEPITENREYPEGGVAGCPRLPLDDGQAGRWVASSVVDVQWNITVQLCLFWTVGRGKKGKCASVSHIDVIH